MPHSDQLLGLAITFIASAAGVCVGVGLLALCARHLRRLRSNSTSSSTRTEVAAHPLSQNERVAPPAAFDVFLSHNSRDKALVREINAELKNAGFHTWFDEEQLLPGDIWSTELERQLETVRTACVFIGADGFGPWHCAETRALLAELVQRQCLVVPVILPTCRTTPRLPLFLRQVTWLDLRGDRNDAMTRLIRALRRNLRRSA